MKNYWVHVFMAIAQYISLENILYIIPVMQIFVFWENGFFAPQPIFLYNWHVEIIQRDNKKSAHEIRVFINSQNTKLLGVINRNQWKIENLSTYLDSQMPFNNS